MDDDIQREWYVVKEHIHDRDLAQRACSAVLDLVGSLAGRATVDAYTDHRKQMPPDVGAAEQALHQRGRAQHRGDPGMGVRLDAHVEDDWSLLARYAPWSINVEVYDLSDELLATFHDCGHDVGARLTPPQASDLAQRLSGSLTIGRFDPR